MEEPPLSARGALLSESLLLFTGVFDLPQISLASFLGGRHRL